MSTFFHRQIEFDVLRKTPKAVLIKVNKVKSTKYNKVYKKFKKFLDPVEMWIPRSWIKKDRSYSYVGMPGNMESYTDRFWVCLLYTSPSPRDGLLSRMPSSA